MIETGRGFVGYGEVDIVDDSVFTRERLDGWYNHLAKSYETIYRGLTEKIDYSSPVMLSSNRALMVEVIVDAAIGMRKVTTSKNNNIENPNAFKEAAYLSYWWLRHKPASFYYDKNYDINEIDIVEQAGWDDAKREEARKRLVWNLKHINELVAVQIASSYIFDFSKPICAKNECKNVRKRSYNFTYGNFDDMRNDAIDTLIYYFSYRALAPKMIEQLLEAYAFHPAWDLTGDLWGNGKGQ